LNSTAPTDLELDRQIVHKQKYQTLVNLTPFALDDNLVVFWYFPTGLAVYNRRRNRICSVLTVPTQKITSFASDATSLAVGTEDGCVISTDLYDFERMDLFRVSQEPIQFVSLCPALNRIYWLAKDHLGAIDLYARRVVTFGGQGLPVTRAVSSFQGALLLQRTPHTLGLFLQKTEIPVLFDRVVTHFCFDEDSGALQSGRFAVLLDSDEILFHSYADNSVRVFRAISPVIALSICWRGDLLAFSSTVDGDVHVWNVETNRNSVAIRRQSCRGGALKFFEEQLSGITAGGFLFVGDATSQIRALASIPIAGHLVMVLTPDNELMIVTVPSFCRLADRSTSLPIPRRDSFTAAKLSETRPVFSREGRDAWLCLSEAPPMRLIASAGVGDAKRYQTAEIDLIRASALPAGPMRSALFPAMLFADRFVEAADLLLSVDAGDALFMHSVLLGSLTLNPLSERQIDKLKKSALILAKNGKFRAAAMFFELGRMTQAAISAFLECGQVEAALNFVRGLPSCEKSGAMLACGGFLLRNGELERAVPFFAGSQAFHPLLFTLYTLGEIADCFFLKRYGEAHGLLKPLEEDQLAKMGTIIGFEELCNMIDAELQSLLCNLNIETTMFFPETD
jgi:hypothetical protein